MGDERDILQAPPIRRALTPAIALGALGTVAVIAQMALLSAIITRAFLQRQHLAQLALPLLLLLAAVLLRAALAWGEEVSANLTALRLTTALRARFIAQVQALGPAFLTGERSGELATTALAGVERLDASYARYLPLQALSVLTPALIVLVLLKVDALAALLLLCTAPIIPLLMVLVGSYARTHVDRHWLALSRLGAQFLDTLQGLPTLLRFGRGDAAGAQVAAASKDFQERTLAVLRVAFLSGMVLDMMTGMAIGLVAVVVAVQLLAGALPFQAALLALLLAPECYRPLRDLGTQRHAAMEGKAAAKRISKVLALPADGAKAPLRSVALDWPLTVRFSGVTFHYPNSERPALRDLSLTLSPGTRTALVGRSGAGKSTAINLLLRFLEPNAGQVAVNGVPLTQLPPSIWRRRIALVPQQPHLFQGTIADNLRLARPDASQADLQHAAELAGAADFIAGLPKAYDTPVGEQGALLSAGEVQRLAIARAFLKDAPLLILDEPTAALDPTHEAQVRQALDRLMVGRTVLIAAHRVNTICTADQIAVLDAGHLIEVGKHDELLARGGAYAQLMAEPTALPPSFTGKGTDGWRHGQFAQEWRKADCGREDGHAPDSASSPVPEERPASSPCIPFFLKAGGRGFGLLAIALGTLAAAAGIGLPATGAYLIGAAALGTPLLMLGVPITLVRLFGVGRGVVRYAERLVSHRVTFARVTELRVWCYRRLLPLAPARLLAHRSGDLLTRLVDDVQTMEERFQRVTLPIAVALGVSVLTVALFASFSLVLAVVLLLFLAIVGSALPWLIRSFSQEAQRQTVTERGNLQTELVDMLQGLPDLLTLRGAGGLPISAARLNAATRRLAHISGWRRGLAMLLVGLATWALLALAVRLSGVGALPGIDLAVLALMTPAAFEVALPLGEAFSLSRRAAAAEQRVQDVLSAEPAVLDLPGPRPMPAAFDLTFDHVTFAYQHDEPAAIRDISFTVPAGAQVAVVGSSGSGKTTLVNLALRFWDPCQGTVRLGGQDIRQYALADLRRRVGLVSQRSYVFNETLRRNLLLARPDASDDELLWALGRARLTQFARNGPHGLDRWVGEQGVQLSGGERQRLAIARTLLQQAPVLLLDEPTANLDPVTAREVLAELAGLAAGRTTLSITHQLVGMEQMDEILVLDKGRLVERGSHGELLRRGGLYRQMVDLQQQFVTA